MMRKVAWLAGLSTLLASGGYVFVYLYRWEWHRALIVGVLFLGAEVAMCTALLYRRLALFDQKHARDTERRTIEADPAVVERLRAHASRRDPFAWLQPRAGRTAVFIPVLLGSGVVVSAVAWVVERIASRTAEPAMERSLARQLSALAFPAGGLLPHDGEILAQDGSSSHSDDVALLLGPGAT